ncbi:MAG: hypothetical protein QM675_06605 [Protaetiibacter sp.]
MNTMLVATMLVATALSSCAPAEGGSGSSAPSASASPAALPAGVSVELVQYRFDYGPRRLQLSVTNGSGHELRVTSIELRSAVFASPVAYEAGQDVPPGTTRDLPVLLSDPVCSPDVAPTAEVIVTVVVDGGQQAMGSLVPSDPLGWLARIHADDCRSAELASSASFTVGPFRVDRGGELPVGYLTITGETVPGGPTVLVSAIDRTILFRPADATSGWPLGWSFDAAHPVQSTELAVVPSNCNPHILAEDKRGTFWPLEVTLGDGETGVVYLASDDALRAELYGYFAEYCGF